MRRKYRSGKGTVRAAVIAALYALLTLMWPLSFGPIQVRISEALTVLPLFTPAAVPGLFIGCLIAGILSSAVWTDVVFGALTTLLAAYLTRRFRKRPMVVSMCAPVVLNALVVGSVVHFAYAGNPEIRLLPVTMLTVGAGEAVACFALGMPLAVLLRRVPEEIW